MSRIDRTDKPTLRYRYPGGLQPMSEADMIFAGRHQSMPDTRPGLLARLLTIIAKQGEGK